MSDDVDREREQHLARRAADGDRMAAEELLGRLYDQIRLVCRRICLHDADDATQEALISVARALPRFDGRSAVRTWAYRIATNAALDELRRRGRRAVPTELTDDLGDTSSAGSGAGAGAGSGAPMLDERVTDRLAIDAALEQLAPEFRAAIVLRDIVGLDYADIADSLGIPVGTVRSRIARGRRQLVDLLDLGNRSAPADVQRTEP